MSSGAWRHGARQTQPLRLGRAHEIQMPAYSN